MTERMTLLGPEFEGVRPIQGRLDDAAPGFVVLRNEDIRFLRKRVRPGEVEVEIKGSRTGDAIVRYVITQARQASSAAEYEEGHWVDLRRSS